MLIQCSKRNEAPKKKKRILLNKHAYKVRFFFEHVLMHVVQYDKRIMHIDTFIYSKEGINIFLACFPILIESIQ